MYPSGLDVERPGTCTSRTRATTRSRSSSRGRSPLGAGHPRGEGARPLREPSRRRLPRGKVYVADTGYNRVQVLNAADGSVTRSGARSSRRSWGSARAWIGSGNPVILVVRERRPHRSACSRRAASRSARSAPARGTAPGQLNGVRDAATDADGNIYAADFANSRVVVFGPDGGTVDAWGVNGTGPQQLKRPYGIDLDPAGTSTSPTRTTTSTSSHRPAASSRVRRAGGRRRQVPDAPAGGARPGLSPDVFGADLWTFKVEIFDPGGHLADLLGVGGPDERLLQRAVRPRRGPAASLRRRHGESAGPALLVQRSVRLPAHLGEPRVGRREPRVQLGPGRHIGSYGGRSTLWVADTKNNRASGVLAGRHPDREDVRERGSAVGQFNWPFAVAAIGPISSSPTRRTIGSSDGTPPGP